MKQQLVMEIVQQMLLYLDNSQLQRLRQTLEGVLHRYDVFEATAAAKEDDSNSLIERFIVAKRIEGCSEKTLKYYQTTITTMVTAIGKNVDRKSVV